MSRHSSRQTEDDVDFRYFIERTQSARSLLDKAVELCPEMVVSDRNCSLLGWLSPRQTCFLQENDDAGSNSDELEEDEPIENVSNSIAMKNVTSHVPSKMSSSRRPNSPSFVGTGPNQRISPAPTTPIHNNQQQQQQQHNKSQHHSRS